MTVRREILYITTDDNAQLQRELATRTRVLAPGEGELLQIQAFTHDYDPDVARAWLARAADPLLPDGRPASQAPWDPASTLRTGVDGAAHATPYPAGRTRANKLRCLGIAGVTEGMAVEAAVARLDRGWGWSSDDVADQETMLDLLRAQAAARPGSPVSLAPDGALAPEVPPAWERVAAQIDRLGPDAANAVVQAQLGAFRNALRAFNLCYPTLLRLRRLAERLWGYYAFSSDNYLRGVSSELILDLFHPYQPSPYVPGEWRVRLARWQQAVWGQRAGAWGPGDVIFGMPWSMQRNHIGCRQDDPNANIISPNNCHAPTGESHRVWFQADATLSGGYNPAWSELLPYLHGRDLYDRADMAWDGEYYMTPNGAPGWRAPFFRGNKPAVGKWRLWALPPLERYWRMYFAPQPEFDGLSLVDWMLALPPAELVRAVRRDNTQRNLRMAAKYDTIVEDLIGRAQVDAARQQLTMERANLRTEQMVAGVGGSAAAALTATGAGAWVGLIVGAATAATVGILRAAQSAMPEVKVDVWGTMLPTFSQFAIYRSRETLTAVLVQEIGAPPGAPAPPPVDPEKAADALALATRSAGARLRIEGMPHYGAVFVDGKRTDDAASTWADEAMTAWVVPAEPGRHEIVVVDPEGRRRVGRVTVKGEGEIVAVVRVADLAPDLPLYTSYEAPGDAAGGKTEIPLAPPRVTPAAPGLSTGAKVALGLGALALLGGGAYVVARRPKRNHRPRARRRRGARASAHR